MNVLKTYGIGQTPAPDTATFTQPAQQQTILIAANPRYPMNLIVSNQGVTLVRGTTSVGTKMSELIAALITVTPSIAPPPYITTQPASQFVAYSTATTFVIVASSYLNLSYQWQCDNGTGSTWTNLTNGAVYTTVTTATLHIGNVTGLNGYQYRCLATDTNSNVATSAAAILHVIPDISVQPGNSTVTQPTGTTFTVTVTGTATLHYQWQCDNGTAGVYWTNITAAGTPGYSGYNTLATLTITTTATTMSTYKYRLVITDGNGQVATSNAAVLTVNP